MEFGSWTFFLIPILMYLVGVAIVLLLLYGVIRVGVSRGLRDHHLWLERNRPQGPAFGEGAPRRF